MNKIRIIFGAAIILSLLNGLAQAQVYPGGVNANYMAWLTPETYDGAGTWTNKITGTGTLGNFSRTQSPLTSTTSAQIVTGYNFHQAVKFATTGYTTAPNQMESSQPFAISTGESFAVFIVAQKGTSPNGNQDYIIAWNLGNNYTASGVWYTSDATTLNTGWGTATARSLGNAPGPLLTIDIPNANGNIKWYNNGLENNFNITANGNGSNTQALRIGSCRYDNNGERGFNGNIQEIIIVKKSSTGTYLAAADVQKIHSYLAVKYGVTLPTGDYVSSDGTVVWNRSTNAGYTANIFGIGRDNDSGLNQVQSQSVNTEMLTIFKGTYGSLNNNSSNSLLNKTFLMLGSNGLVGNSTYEYPANEAFQNGSLTDKINYHSTAVYKAQITSTGTAGGSQTVGVRVFSSSARYVLVSTDPTFPKAITRIYAINGLQANNVVINDGEFVTTAGFQAVPGGATGITFAAWLTPDSYNKSGTWVNNIGGAIGNFTGAQSAPQVSQTAGYNYHPAMKFDKSSNNSAPNQLLSEQGMNVLATDNISMLFVLQRLTTDNYDYLIGFDNSDAQTSLSWRTNNSNVLSFYWPNGTNRTIGTVQKGILTLDNTNTTAGGVDVYVDGVKAHYTSGSWNNANDAGTRKIALGGARNDSRSYGYQGYLQEVILIKNPTNSLMNATELSKIHSYLAIKYGITLNSGADNYIISDGTIVWNADATYKYNIFGIGRDDNSSLYQKQSVSATSSRLKMFLGSTLRDVNSSNTATIPDKQLLMIGDNGLTTASTISIADQTPYENGNIDAPNGLNFQYNAVYKAQVTGATPSMTAKFQVAKTYSYALVSQNTAFSLATTRIYPVSTDGIVEITLDNTYRYIRFVGYSAGPGGVSTNLSLWLRADDDNMLTIENLASTDAKISSYSGVTGDNSETVPAVSHWIDYMRNMDYSYYSTTQTRQRMPVYKSTSLTMNFHPAIRMWTTGSIGSYLRNNTGVMSTAHPNHTAIFITNNDFSSNAWIYPMSFYSSMQPSNYYGPSYGMERTPSNSTNVAGRVRLNSSNVSNSPSNNMFQMGTTTISLFRLNSNSVTYRFNAVESVNTGISWSGNSNMTEYSIIPGGYQEDRIIQGDIAEVILFNQEITGTDLNSIESYLAFKYGVTLRPNTGTGRYNYKIKNSSVSVWNGDQASGEFVDFYNNVSAVVRDDAALLNNRQSHSTNTGSLLHMGVAGKQLGLTNYDVGELQDGEAVAFGANTATGVTTIQQTGGCGDFDNIFNRKWLIHKITNGDRPVTMLVGAENNILNNLGKDASTEIKAYYNLLIESNELYMVVASSPANIDAGNYTAVVPMTYLNGEHQCAYTFTDEETYITFGYKQSTSGCAGEVEFQGNKTYRWNTQWTRQNYGTANVSVIKPALDLGDDISITTSVVYDSNVTDIRYYPQSSTTLGTGSLQIQRRGGLNGKVTVTLNFNHPVIPEFAISDIDGANYTYEKITVKGSCTANPNVIPALTYASSANASSYVIAGNTATVRRNGNLSGTNRNGQLNVAFTSGVTQVVIEYTLINRAPRGSTTNVIFISPITIKGVPLPPPVNEDGLSFVKDVDNYDITTCETPEYSFYISNTNCVEKYVNFTDVLPAGMTWVAGTLELDSINSNPALNPTIVINKYGDTNRLQITDLQIPGSTELRLRATATVDPNAVSQIQPTAFGNRATLAYEKTVNSQSVPVVLNSLDRFTLQEQTVINVTWAQRPDTVKLTSATTNPTKYGANSEVTVTIQVTNPNPISITNMFLNVGFDAGFTYVNNSYSGTSGSIISPLEDGLLEIASDSSGDNGFVLPIGTTTFTFKLKAPDQANLEPVLDGSGTPIAGQTAPLNIDFEFYSTMDDPCVLESMNDLFGILDVPYGQSRTHIITNKNVTAKIRR